MPSLTLDIKKGSKLHQRIVDAVRDRVRFSKNAYLHRHKKWIKNEEAALAYLPEREVDAQRRLNRDEGGKPAYTTIVLPYSYGVLMASHTYWTTVFLSRSPILQYTGRHGESEQQIQCLEALMDYQVNVGGMMVPLYIWLLDVGKYGLGVTGNYWVEEFANVSEIVEVEQQFLNLIPTGKKKKQKISRRIPGYVGNKIYNIRPYDFFPDPRLPLSRFQEGEFCADYFELGWNTILRRRDAGFYTNIDELKLGEKSADAREPGSSQLTLPDTDNIFEELNARKTKDVVKGYQTTIELVPSNWGLGKSGRLEKWVFTVTSDFTLCIGAQPHGALHNKYPYNIMEFEPEGYAIANRGLPEIIEPIQRTMDWLINSHFYNVRKTINNQFLVDPSRVVMKDVLDPAAGGVIRAKESAYGTDMRTAIHQLQVTDVTRTHMQDLRAMIDIGIRATGVNDQIHGMIAQGGRKTAQEVRTSSTFGVNRLKTNAEYFSAMGWAPMSQMFVQNTQQYYDAEKKFKVVGDLMQDAGEKFVEVDAESIQGFYDFVPVDGTLPVDRFAQANLWREMFAQMRNMPEVAAKYDLGKLFGWVAQLAGLKNIKQFEIKMAPDEQLQDQAQKGNIVPLGTEPRKGERDLGRVPEPGQIRDMGSTG